MRIIKQFILLILLFVVFHQNCYTQFHIIKTQEDNKFIGDKILSNYGWEFLTYFGGSSPDGFITVVSDKKYIYVGGTTSSNDFNFHSRVYGRRWGSDYLILKLDLEGKYIWGTILGSSGDDYLFALAIDSTGNIWGCGETRGADFPTTPNAIQKTYRGEADGAVFKLDSNGTLKYSTYLGGSNYEGLTHIVVNIDNTIWITGRTRSSNFPLTNNAKQKNLLEEYNTPIIRFSNEGTLLYSSFFGGTSSYAWTLGDALDVSHDGKIVFTGYTNSTSLPISPNAFQKTKSSSFDSFISVFDSSGNVLWCTYFGGSGVDYASQLTIDKNNNIYVLHYTNSPDLPVKNSNLMSKHSGLLDIFISVFDSSGNYLSGSYFGGPDYEAYDYYGLNYLGGSIKVLENNYLSCFFRTRSKNLPWNLQPPSMDFDSYFLLLDSSLNLIFSTYIGGKAYDSAGDMIPMDENSFIVCGQTISDDLNTFNPLQKELKGSYDGFIGLLKLNLFLDTIPPQYFSVSDSCGTIKIYVISDSQSTKSGIATINPLVLNNVSFYLVQKSKYFAKFTVSLLDKSRKGYYKLEVIDNSNNKIVIEDSLLNGISDLLYFSPSKILDFGKANFYKNTCKSIWLVNKTTDTLVLNRLTLRWNIDFSLPPSQFPLTLNPLDSVALTICFAPFQQKNSFYFDTLDINEQCFFEKLYLQAKIDTNIYTSNSKCNVILAGKSILNSKLNKIRIIQLERNQLLVISDESKQIFDIKIYDLLGNLIFSEKNLSTPYLFDSNFLNQSPYFLIVNTKDEIINLPLVPTN